MSDFVTLIGNIRNIARGAAWGTVNITSTDAPKAEDGFLVVPGTSVVQLDSSGSFSIPLGAGTYTLTLNDTEEVSFTIPAGPFTDGQTITLTSLLS